MIDGTLEKSQWVPCYLSLCHPTARCCASEFVTGRPSPRRGDLRPRPRNKRWRARCKWSWSWPKERGEKRKNNIYSLIYMQSRKSSIYNYCKYALARYKWFWNIKLTQHCSVSQHIPRVQIKQKKTWQFHTYESTAAAVKWWSVWVFTSVYVTIVWVRLRESGNDMATRLFASIIPVPCLAPWQGQASVKERMHQKACHLENDPDNLNHIDFDFNHYSHSIILKYIQYIAI